MLEKLSRALWIKIEKKGCKKDDARKNVTNYDQQGHTQVIMELNFWVLDIPYPLDPASDLYEKNSLNMAFHFSLWVVL